MPAPQNVASTLAPPTLVTQEAVFGLLKNNLLRRFKVDIETASTIAGDESQEKQDRTQFIESMTKFMEAWGPMVMQKPELAPLAGQLLLFGVRSFRVGRELEEVIEETADKLASPQAMQKGPDPKVQAEQVKLQAAQAKTQAEVQKAQMDAQTGQQAAAAKLQEIIAESQAKLAELRMKIQAAEQDHQHKGAEAAMAHGAAMDKMAGEQQKAQLAQLPKWPVDPGKTQGF
jgi:septal ring factor EnvC (AmiA/AmiB activator)